MNVKTTIKKIIKKLITTPVWELYQSWRKKEHEVLENAELGKHVLLYPPYSCISSRIGDYSYVAPGAQISQTTIGKFCSIGPNFLCGWGIHPLNGVSTSPMFYSPNKQNGTTLSKTAKLEERKPISIGNDVFIGANVTILDGIRIGDGAVIGAGAIVSKDIPPYAIAAGSPVRILRYRFDEETIAQLLNIEWWNFSDEQLRSVEENFFDLPGFIRSNKPT
jgi:acetyltransferase-like isoleucine patch superfamily enzyme